MGWSVGFDSTWNRDIGYGVPATCDHPGCGKAIDRGLGHVCGNQQPYGGDEGCGLFFCGTHGGGILCERCENPPDIGSREPFDPTPDVPEWLRHKLRNATWKQWRDEHPEDVKRIREILRAAACA